MTPSQHLRTAAGRLILACERRIEAGWQAPADTAAALQILAADVTHDDFAAVDARFKSIAAALELSDQEIRIVAATALAEVHLGAATIMGTLGGSQEADTPTMALVLELAGLPSTSEQGWDLLAPTSHLVRTKIVQLVSSGILLARRARIHPTITRRIHGDESISAALQGLLTRLYPVVDEPEITRCATAIRNDIPLIWIHSPVGAAGAGWAGGICSELGAIPLAVDLSRIASGSQDAINNVATDLMPSHDESPLSPAQARDVVDELVLEARLDGSALVVLSAGRVASAMDALVAAPIPVIAVAGVPWNPHWHAEVPLAVTARRLTTAQRQSSWQAALGAYELDRQITVLRMTPEQIGTVGRAADRITRATGEPVTASMVTRIAHSLSTKAPSVPAAGRTPATLSDLVLPDHALQEIERLIGWGRYRDDVLASSQLQGKGGKGTGIAALFSGGPGTGKTLAAHVVADALGMELMQVDLSSIVDKYIGETEKNLEKVFSAAESMNCVLFFDEADSLFGSRSAVNDSRDRYANQEVAYLLQRIEAFDGITVMATNLRGNIDTAFARRLHFMIHFPDPDEPTRLRLWQHHLDQVDLLSETDPPQPDVLASALEIAGGDIRNIVLAGAYDAVSTAEPLSMSHLVTAASREFTKLGRRVPAEALAAPRTPHK
ncbi:ATPase family associated with various cellular activities (AAA) [Micrococcales bacterium KH10]|nr:ATPase family associated with various cellular activities (AAA) [Micrococcales bacterium KH10]